jgi:pimeloyl-ACP methyl ester carboxylesterase
MTRYFEAQDGRRLAFQDSGGTGPVVLCLAGLSRNGRDFASLAAHLADRFRVLRLDSRGRGMSERAADPLAEYTVPVEAGDALALLDHLEVPRAAVVGTSRGGVLGMVLGASQRERVSCLVLNDVGPVIETHGLDDIMVYLGVEPKVDSFEAAAEELQQTMGAGFPDLTPPQWLGFARTIYRDEGGRPRLSYDPRLRDAIAAVLEETPPDLWDLFDALAGLPILTLRGANSVLFSAETLTEMARRRPDMAQAVVPNRGHPPFLDEPVAVAAIDAFLEEHAT